MGRPHEIALAACLMQLRGETLDSPWIPYWLDVLCACSFTCLKESIIVLHRLFDGSSEMCTDPICIFCLSESPRAFEIDKARKPYANRYVPGVCVLPLSIDKTCFCLLTHHLSAARLFSKALMEVWVQRLDAPLLIEIKQCDPTRWLIHNRHLGVLSHSTAGTARLWRHEEYQLRAQPCRALGFSQRTF